MSKTSKKLVKSSSQKLGKAAGIFSSILGIPEMIDGIGKVVDKAAPIVEKNIDRRHEHLQSLVPIPNLIDVDIDQAKQHLEKNGLSVIAILAKPNKRYAKADLGEVVAMHPKSGKLLPGGLVKLYYVDETVIEQSQRLVIMAELKKEASRTRFKENVQNLQDFLPRRK